MLLDKINSPQDLKKLTIAQLNSLSAEVRRRIINVVSKTGGHLASSLGAVEIITALHYCLDTPKDKIIFDVGHQTYAHKILTGRNKKFDTLRQFGGLSGFPSKDESEFDIFTVGHSSNAVSLALGLVCARDAVRDPENFKVVAVIGDGSLSGGLCFEGLNNAGHLKKDMLVILNTNEMSIAPNVGAISTYLNKLISLPIYNRFKDNLEKFLESRVPKGSKIKKLTSKFEEGIKGLFIPGMLFEEMGFRYFGPLDGHNYEMLIPTLKNILDIKGPRILHVITKKGKGYLPAEKEPVRFHGTGPFEVSSGNPISSLQDGIKSYTSFFSDKLVELAKTNKKIVAITAAMPEGTGLDKFKENFPNRFFDVGIAEAHAVTFAAGLAKGGFKPVVAIYSSFFQRALDQIIEDVAIQKLPVIFALDRAGIVGEDGVTHHGLFDISTLRNIPNISFMAPKDGIELSMMLEYALSFNTPTVIRYPRGVCKEKKSFTSYEEISLGKSEILKYGNDFTVIALGSMVEISLEAVNLLEKEGLKGTLVNARFIKPLDTLVLQDLAMKIKNIFTVEEGIIDAGFGSAVAEILNCPVYKFGLPSEFVAHGKKEILLEKYGLTATAIATCIKQKIKKNG